MSLFLGKIHFWLFNKVLWFEGLEEEIINLAQEEGLDVEALSAEINAKYGQKTENKKTRVIELNLLVRASDSTKVATAQNIKEQLANQGIRINIVQAADQQYNNMINSKSYDIALCSMTMSPSPNLELFFGDNNLSNYSNEEVSNILAETKNTTDENVLKEKYKRLIEIYKSDVPYISLYNNKYTIAYNSELVGEFTPNWFNAFYGIEEWYK